METVLNTSNRRGKKRKEEKEKERKRGGNKETNIQEYKYLNQRRFFIETLVIVPFNSPKFADEEKKKNSEKKCSFSSLSFDITVFSTPKCVKFTSICVHKKCVGT